MGRSVRGMDTWVQVLWKIEEGDKAPWAGCELPDTVLGITLWLLEGAVYALRSWATLAPPGPL